MSSRSPGLGYGAVPPPPPAMLQQRDGSEPRRQAQRPGWQNPNGVPSEPSLVPVPHSSGPKLVGSREPTNRPHDTFASPRDQGAPSSPAPSSASLSPRHASLGRLQNRPDLSREFKTSPSSPAPHTPSPDDTPVERARKRPAAQGRWQAPDVTGSQADDETGGSRATPATSRAHGAAPVRSPRSSQVSSSRGSFADEIDRRPAAHGTPERNPTFSDMAFSMHLDSASGAPAESAAPSQPGAAPQPDPAESDAPSTGPKEGPGGSSDFSGFQPSTGPVFEHPMLHAMDMESPSKTEASSQPTQELPRHARVARDAGSDADASASHSARLSITTIPEEQPTDTGDQGRAPYPGSPGEGGDEADEAVDLEGAINRAQVALSEVQMSESRLVDLIASSSSSVDALLGLLLSLVRPLVEQPPAEVAMYYAQRPGRGAARQKPGPGRDDQMLLALIDAGNHGKSFAWLLRDSARMWQWMGWLADPGSMPGGLALREAHYHLPCGDATLRVLDRLSSADVGHELATVSPAAPALVAFCDAVVAQQQAMDALLSHHSVPLDSPALVPASLARHVISTAAESASPSSTVSLGFRHRDASRADSGAEMASSSASQSAHEPPHPHQPSRLAQSWPRVDASGAAWSRGEEDGEGREHGEVGPERGGEDRERDPFRELEGMLGHSRARELLEAAVERYAEQRLETIVRAVMSKAAAEGAAPATTGAAQTVVADGAGGEPAAALAQGAPPTTTLPAAQDGAAANLAPGSQRVTTAPAHDNEDEDFSSLPDSPRSAVSSARGQPPALTPNPVFESAAADVATTHAEAPGPSTAAPAGAQDAAAQPSQPDAQASPQQDPAAAAPAPAAPQAGSPPDVTTPAHAESARPSPGPPSGQASAQAPIRSAFSLTATPRKESKSPVAAAAEDGPAAAARPPEESPSEPRPEAMHDVAAAELEAMLREMTPLFQKMVSNLLQALKVLFEDASTSLFDDFDDRRGRGALGGLEERHQMVDAAFGALVEPMGHRLAHALHKTAVSAAHGMYARLSQYVPGENLDNTAGLLPPNLPDYLSRLAKYVPEMRGDSGEVRASAETWATLERGVRGLSKALGESKKRLGTIAAVMKNVSDLQGSLEAAARDLEEANRREHVAEEDARQARMALEEARRQVEVFRTQMAQGKAREESAARRAAQDEAKVQELYRKLEGAESRATIADRRAAEATKQAMAAKDAADELATKVSFLEMENKLLRDTQPAPGDPVVGNGMSVAADIKAQQALSGGGNEYGNQPSGGRAALVHSRSMRAVMGSAIAEMMRASATRGDEANSVRDSYGGVPQKTNSHLSDASTGSLGLGNYARDDSLFGHPIYEAASQFGAVPGRQSPGVFEAMGQRQGYPQAMEAGPVARSQSSARAESGNAPGSARSRPAQRPGAAAARVAERTYVGDGAFQRAKAAAERGAGGAALDRRIAVAMDTSSSARENTEAAIDAAMAAVVLSLRSHGVDLDVSKVSGPRFKFNGKLGTVRSTNGRLMVIGGAGAMPIWDFMEKLQRKAAR